MQSFDRIKNYSDTVISQIRWEKAHPSVVEEIEDHLTEQRDAYIKTGLDEAEATDKAIKQMGDPVTVGAGLDRIHRPRSQWSMIILIVALLAVGMITRYLIIDEGQKPLLFDQLFITLAGLGLMTIAYYLDFTLIGKYPKTTLFSILALTMIALLFSPLVNGRVYYSSYIPLAFPLAFSVVIYHIRNKGLGGLIGSVLIFYALTLLTFLFPVKSGFVLFTVSGFTILITAVAKGWFDTHKLAAYFMILFTAVLTLLTVFLYIYSDIYRSARFEVLLSPASDPQGAGYLTIATRNLLSGAKVFGPGDMPAQYAAHAFPLPGIDTDYLLTYLVFHIGWIAFIIITALLLCFIIKGMVLCFRQKSVLGLLVSLAIMMTFTMQTVIYIVNNLGLQLTSALSLPLISYGNTATLVNLLLLGIMLSVFRNGGADRDQQLPQRGNNSFISWDQGKLIISFSRK